MSEQRPSGARAMRERRHWVLVCSPSPLGGRATIRLLACRRRPPRNKWVRMATPPTPLHFAHYSRCGPSEPQRGVEPWSRSDACGVATSSAMSRVTPDGRPPRPMTCCRPEGFLSGKRYAAGNDDESSADAQQARTSGSQPNVPRGKATNGCRMRTWSGGARPSPGPPDRPTCWSAPLGRRCVGVLRALIVQATRPVV